MNSSKTFDNVIQYLEEVIIQDGVIDYNTISNIAACPASLFQRVFVYVSGITIAEYVRKRKLTLAGYALRNSCISVLDAALKYGFHSHSAFTRAFKDHHGFTPSEAKVEGKQLKVYPKMDYAEMRFIGGKRIMANMKRIIYKDTPERLMVGIHHSTSFMDAGNAWQAFFQSEAIRQLNEGNITKCCDDIDENAGIGMMYNFTDMNHFELIIGDFAETGSELPDTLFYKQVPAGKAAYIQIEGNNVSEILESAYLLITEAIEKTCGKIDNENFYWCEVYTIDGFCRPTENGGKVTIDYILPVIM